MNVDAQLVVRVSTRQKMLLGILADSENVSVGELTRRILDDYLQLQRGEKNLLAKLAKIGEKGKKIKTAENVSVNYKKILY